MNTQKNVEMEDVLSSLHAVMGMLTILWEAVDGHAAVEESVYGIREYLGSTIDKLEVLHHSMKEEET